MYREFRPSQCFCFLPFLPLHRDRSFYQDQKVVLNGRAAISNGMMSADGRLLPFAVKMAGASLLQIALSSSCCLNSLGKQRIFPSFAVFVSCVSLRDGSVWRDLPDEEIVVPSGRSSPDCNSCSISRNVFSNFTNHRKFAFERSRISMNTGSLTILWAEPPR